MRGCDLRKRGRIGLVQPLVDDVVSAQRLDQERRQVRDGEDVG